MLAIHTYGHLDVPTPKSVWWRLQLPTCQQELQDNISWRWEPGILNNSQQPWAALWSKGSSQFLLSPMELWHQHGPSLREFRPGQPTAGQMGSRKVPAVTTLPSVITPPMLKVPAYSNSVKRRNFRKTDWKRFCLLTGDPSTDCHLWTQQTTRGHSRNYAWACYLQLHSVYDFLVEETYVEVWGIAQRRECLRGMLSLHAEMLDSPNATNDAA